MSETDLPQSDLPQSDLPGSDLPGSDPSGPDLSESVGADYDILDDLIGYTLRRAQLHVFQDIIETLRPWDLRPAQFSTLVMIAANPGLSQAALADLLAVERSAMVKILDTFERRGLARRRPSTVDRRRNAVGITPRGQTLLDQVKAKAREHEARMVGFLSGDEKARLLAALRRIYGDA